MNSLRITILVLAVIFKIAQVTSICCARKSDFFGCCGVGTCNIFCCNCDDGCKHTVTISVFTFCANKRSIDDYSDSNSKTNLGNVESYRVFPRMYINKNDMIDIDEAAALHPSLKVDVKPFNEVDSNRNGVIESIEFDNNL